MADDSATNTAAMAAEEKREATMGGMPFVGLCKQSIDIYEMMMMNHRILYESKVGM